MTLFKPQITSVRDGNFFANRVISHWNSLSNNFVSSASVEAKTQISEFSPVISCLLVTLVTCQSTIIPALVSCKPHFYVLLLILICYHTSVCFTNKI